MYIVQKIGHTTIIFEEYILRRTKKMEMQNLLEKNRVMHHLLQKAAGDALEFDEVARQLKELMGRVFI